jgi:hypothetical protein
MCVHFVSALFTVFRCVYFCDANHTRDQVRMLRNYLSFCVIFNIKARFGKRLHVRLSDVNILCYIISSCTMSQFYLNRQSRILS